MLDGQDDHDRVATLAAYDLTDATPERAFDAIVRDAATLMDAPISMISLVDDRRQFFKAKLGVAHDEDPIDQSICAHAIRGDDVFVVQDAREDDRFRDLAGVTGATNIRFYAGAPLTMRNGVRVGTLCVIDVEPRTALDAAERRLLQGMARRTVAAFEQRRRLRAEGDAADRNPALWLDEARDLLDRASLALEEAGATAALAHLAQVTAMVDELHGQATATG